MFVIGDLRRRCIPSLRCITWAHLGGGILSPDVAHIVENGNGNWIQITHTGFWGPGFRSSNGVGLILRLLNVDMSIFVENGHSDI